MPWFNVYLILFLLSIFHKFDRYINARAIRMISFDVTKKLLNPIQLLDFFLLRSRREEGGDIDCALHVLQFQNKIFLRVLLVRLKVDLQSTVRWKQTSDLLLC